MKIISSILIIITAVLSIKHGWDGFHIDANPEQAKMAAELGIGRSVILVMSVVGIAIGTAVLFPQTYYIACVVNAITIVLIMALSLKAGNYKTALIEIPFLLMPLLIIYLGHPLKR
ncbi:hypothetical protein IM792_02440 [Mucilaginibacter sp. JRF]|uniref:hypothetical protein n=1 Tax=Mucilaginibacter sp. JRF TaxID=2780088 RepID=UPI00187FF5D1|nr:hypothetical protein [Mucilaginibacter sp. JRF]MBE9583297.1 hypothetical protein [Mucilaginibacter sp. JRF]